MFAPNLDLLDFKKKCFSDIIIFIFEAFEVQVGSKHRPKIDPKVESENGIHLGIDVRTILMDFGCQNGTNLVPNWDQKTMLTSKGEFSKKKIPKENRVF